MLLPLFRRGLWIKLQSLLDVTRRSEERPKLLLSSSALASCEMWRGVAGSIFTGSINGGGGSGGGRLEHCLLSTSS